MGLAPVLPHNAASRFALVAVTGWIWYCIYTIQLSEGRSSTKLGIRRTHNIAPPSRPPSQSRFRSSLYRNNAI